MVRNEVRERMLADGPRALSDADLLTMLGADGAAGRSVAEQLRNTSCSFTAVSRAAMSRS